MSKSSRSWILFRVDSGRQIGAGHVMRCLSLANELRAAAVDCLFLCRGHEGHLAEMIRAAGHRTSVAPVEAGFGGRSDYSGWRGGTVASEIDWATTMIAAEGGVPLLVVDHYGLDAAYEAALRPICRGVVAFDDLYDKPHACDILIDQNIGHTPDFFGNLAPGAQLLVGARYAPVHPAFASIRDATLARRKMSGRARVLLISVGGFDHMDVTSCALKALDPASGYGLDKIEKAHVVLTGGAPHLAHVRFAVEKIPVARLHIDTVEMPALLAASDLAIGGAGVSAIERCVLGLPTLTVVMAENQEGAARRLEEFGAAVTLGHGRQLTPGDIAEAVCSLSADEVKLQRMIEKAASLCDGQGLARIIAPIVALLRGK